MKLIQYCSLLFFLCYQNICAQSFDNKEYLKALASIETHIYSGEELQAIKESNRYLLIIALAKGKETKANAIYTKLVACYGSLSDLNSVDSILNIQFNWMKKYGGSHLDWGKYYHNKSKILQYNGKSKLALTGMQLAICRKWLSLPRDYKTIIASYREAGKIADDLDHKSAKYFYDKAYQLASKLTTPDPSLEYDLLAKYALHLFIDGEFDLLEKLYKKSEKYQYSNEFTKISNSITTALDYSEYVLIPNKRFDEAKWYLENAKTLAKQSDQVESIPMLDISLANIEFSLGNYHLAAPELIAAYTKCIIFKQAIPPFIRVRIIYNIIESLIQSKDLNAADHWLSKYVELTKSLGTSSIGLEFEYQLLKTWISILRNPTERPITELIGKLNEYGCDISKPLTEKDIINFPFLEDQLYTLHDLIDSMPSISDKIPWEQVIMNLCLRQIEVHDYKRSYQVNTKVNFGVKDRYINAIQKGLLAGLNLFKKTKDLNVFIKVCQLSEKNRNNLLISNLQLNRAETLELPDELRNQEKQITSNIRNVLSENSKGISVDNLDKQVESLKEYKLWLNSLSKNYPKYYRLRYQFQLFDFQKFHDNIENDSICFVTYTRVGNEIIVNWTSKTKYGIESIPADDSFDLNQKELIKAINEKQSIEVFNKPANNLYNRLLSFIPSSVNKLIISHDGQLNQIPFELLTTSNKIAQSWRQVPFLIKEKTIFYTPGWTSFIFHDDSKRNYSYEYWGLCYDPGKENIEKLSPIPMACSEVKDCAQLWRFNKSTISENVSVNQLKIASKSAKILHIACHAVANPTNGNLSYLWLMDSTINSGTKLTVAELYKWNLESKITILSSCQSASGAEQRGEGIIGLTRAFQFAGNKNIVSNLWSVPDFQTKILVTDFMKNLRKGIPCDLAIRISKLQYLNNQLDQYSHPYYWGALVLSSLESNTNQIIIPSNSNLSWLGICIGLGLGIILFLKFKKERQVKTLK